MDHVYENKTLLVVGPVPASTVARFFQERYNLAAQKEKWQIVSTGTTYCDSQQNPMLAGYKKIALICISKQTIETLNPSAAIVAAKKRGRRQRLLALLRQYPVALTLV